MASRASVSLTSPDASSKREIDLERKRARDRKSQQAMRDRAKWTLQNLTEQVHVLTKALKEQTEHANQVKQRMQYLESENEHLRVQNAALRLSLLGDPKRKNSGTLNIPIWKLPPNNCPPISLSDSILQDAVTRKRTQLASNAPSPATTDSLQAPNYPPRPNFCALIDKEVRADDDISNLVSDVIRSYSAIETLPNQVAVAYVMVTFLRWQVMLDEPSWNHMPEWLRPTQAQLTKPHPAWIDRMPWPGMRDCLIDHPEITLEDLAVVYSSSFFIRWEYDPSHVLISVNSSSNVVITNPIYEEHIRQLKNWSLGEPFRKRFPELAEAADRDICGG
ncbi:uncharacterized protein PV09_06388 [Verruconis gallopava]|uniref:BZIP domain-containing protein n=1 Tax=Verruconis gallopava TaxID=253628 RepID=A0A0D2A6N0_9PEZI|nr:uncharacterized protein PV09_06388 [Verruconis gallopava]KIW02235.1 hypothetical protein PV09_06388 [Verruconis gallopava]